jgi:hypothetical protein
MPYNVDKLIKKWSDPALGKLSVADIQDETLKENLVNLLENQDTKDPWGNDLLTEGQANNTLSNMGGTLDGASNTNAYQWKPVSLALVRRVFPQLFANKTVGVQPMSTPVGVSFAIRSYYKDTTNEVGWDNVPEYAGYTGSTSGTSAALTPSGDTSATGVAASVAEPWEISPTGAYPQVDIKMDQITITAMTRKLAATYSLETAQDIAAMHNINIEREMVRVLQYEIQAELDRELLYRMKTAAQNTANGGAVIQNVDVNAFDGRWSQEKIQTVLTAIIHQSQQIAIATKQMAGNFVIVSPDIATCLMAAAPMFKAISTNVDTGTAMTEIGTLNSNITVYRDNYASGASGYALVGLKGPGNMHGLVYSPYISSVMNRAIDDKDFSPRIGVLSRYAITDSLYGSGRYYRLINFSNTNLLIPTA